MIKGFFKKADIFLFVAIIVVGLAAAAWLAFHSESGDKVNISVDGKPYATYRLSENRNVVVRRGGKVNIITIHDGKVSMSEASCSNQVCVQHRAISATGESIICLPNKVVVSIEGKGENKYDTISS